MFFPAPNGGVVVSRSQTAFFFSFTWGRENSPPHKRKVMVWIRETSGVVAGGKDLREKYIGALRHEINKLKNGRTTTTLKNWCEGCNDRGLGRKLKWPQTWHTHEKLHRTYVSRWCTITFRHCRGETQRLSLPRGDSASGTRSGIVITRAWLYQEHTLQWSEISSCLLDRGTWK